MDFILMLVQVENFKLFFTIQQLIFISTSNNMFSYLQQIISQNNLSVTFNTLEQFPVSTISDKDENTLIHLSAREGNSFVTEYLIIRGCNVNALNRYGDTPLNFAILCSSEETVTVAKLLINAGANVLLKNLNGRGPLHFFLQKPCQFLGKVLLEGIEASGLNLEEIADLLSSTQWPLQYIIWLNRCALTQIIIDRGANVNCADKNGYTPLHEAVIVKDPEQVILLLKYGADIQAKTLQGDTPLHTATLHNARESHYQVIKLLLENGADISCVDVDGRTPLLFALKTGTINIVNLLLQYGSKLDRTDKKNKTALHFAACNSDKNVMNLVLNSGIDFEIDGKSSKLLTPLHIATRKANVEVIKLLLENGANVNALDQSNRSPLIKTIIAYHNYEDDLDQEKFLETVQILLQHDADVNPGMEQEEIILELASILRTMDIAQLILKEIAIREMRGLPIDMCNYTLIESMNALKNYYNSCKTELMMMKRCKVYDLVSMLNILIDNSKVVSGYARNEELISAFEHSNYTMNFPIYHATVTDRFFKIVKQQRLRKNAAEALSNILGNIDSSHIVIENILNEFSEEEMYQLVDRS